MAFRLLFRIFAAEMKKAVTILLLALLSLTMKAQPESDPRSIQFMGIPLEGPVDSMRVALKTHEFTEWGASDDGEDLYFRGKYYGIRAKLLVSIEPQSGLVRSAYVTIGPYSTKSMLERNLQYFRLQLEKEYGALAQRDGAYYYMDDYGNIKLSVVKDDSGSSDIRVLYYPTAPFYKDALCLGFHGSVQEVVTDNAVSEDRFLRFMENGQLDSQDLTNRQYDNYGYLVKAQMAEENGHSEIEYEYDGKYNLKRRTLTNEAAGIRYINEYTFNSQGEIMSESQKVYERSGECIMTINMRNSYMTRDDNGNWTSNSLSLTYWEKGGKSQQTTVLQKRTLTYWE